MKHELIEDKTITNQKGSVCNLKMYRNMNPSYWIIAKSKTIVWRFKT